MQKCTEKQQSSFRRLGTERGLLCRRDHRNWFLEGRGDMVMMAPGGSVLVDQNRRQRKGNLGEKMHIVMFPNGKEVRISRLEEPTFSATSECSPNDNSTCQACPAMYPSVSDRLESEKKCLALLRHESSFHSLLSLNKISVLVVAFVSRKFAGENKCSNKER